MAVTLGKSIQILRRAKGLSQGQLAKGASLSVPYLSLIEADKRQPSMPVIERMSSELGVPTLFLVRRSMSENASNALGAASPAEAGIESAIENLIEVEGRLEQLVNGTESDESVREGDS